MGKIKKLIEKIMIMVLDAYYLFYYYKAEVKDNIIVIESKKGYDIADNMFYILKEISENHSEYKIYVGVKSKSKKKIENILNIYNIKNVFLVNVYSPKYLKLLASAKYLFNDTTFANLYIKKEEQVYLNTWHGTPLKKMGNDDVNKYSIGNVMRDLIMSDFLVFSNREMEEKMINAYSLDNLFNGKIMNVGSPRNTIFFDKDITKETKKKLNIDNQRILAYMPTWREVETDIEQIIEYLQYLENNLDDNDILYVKMHVFDDRAIDITKFNKIKPFPKDIETYELLNIVDILITDYSSIMFDFANTNKKIILFAYDLEQYIKNRGLYYSLDELPFPVVSNIESLLKEINNTEKIDYKEFKNKYCTYDYLNATKDIVEFILNGKQSKELSIKTITPNGKKNTIFFVSSLDLNGVTTSILSLLSIIDTSKENYYFTFFAERLKKNPERLEQLPKNSNVFPIAKGFNYSTKEIFAFFMYHYLNIDNKFTNKYVTRHYQREIKRFYGGAHFDKAIQYTGYHPGIIRLFQEMDAKRAIFVHNDMNAEMKIRKIQHYLTLKSAYLNYDKVVGVSEVAINSAIKISGRTDNTIIIENAFDYKKILNKSKEEFKFDNNTESNFSEEEIKKVLNSTSKKFINIARFSPEKGQKRLIEAFDEFYQKDNDTYLIILGGHGDLYEELITYAKTLDCRGNVIFIKSMTNPFTVLSRCDLFILSSIYEGLGLVLLEANVLDVPSFTTDISGPSEFLRAHGGYVVEDSTKGIYQGMIDYTEGKVGCFKFDIDEYNDRIAKQFENLLK